MWRSLVILVLLYVSFAKGEGATARDGYTYYPTARGFLKLHRDPTPWDSARIQCHGEDAELASPLHYGLKHAIKEVQSAEPQTLPVLFSGIHATFAKGLFTSVKGVPLNKMSVDWAPSIDEDQLEKLNSCLVSYANGTMGDKGCDETLPYLCYAEVPICGVDLEYQLDNRTDRCYKFHSQAELWEEAYRICQQEGGYLAIINSDLEATVLKELFAKYPPEKISNAAYRKVVSLGFHSWRQNGVWWTIHGETLSEAGYSKWGDKQPESNDTCGAMFRNGELDDLRRGYKEAFICEKAPPMRPCTACDHNDDPIY